MLEWLENEPVISRIYARSYESNEASIHVLKKTGFIYQPDGDDFQPGGKITQWEWPEL
ncbi:hypothetical protein MFLO_07957 [Listeria floridensis FSL S10-1187]|uniref:Acetyltransferase n=1 Tax=Listeria floridensis FSL S10-1187 TaxID=1265817 RepID=A0ABN0RFL5_9LIST|nr:hypothetical protein MFLO_07957 [Listeria floridensis FSL S10-1187]